LEDCANLLSGDLTERARGAMASDLQQQALPTYGLIKLPFKIND